MKRQVLLASFLLCFLLVSFKKTDRVEDTFQLKSVTASIKGTSSLHDWESEIKKIEFKGEVELQGTTGILKDIEVKIPVESIKSKEGRIMDNKTYEAFQSEKNPYIIYKVAQAQVNVDPAKAVTIESNGQLVMAGTTLTQRVSVKGNILPNGDWHLSVSKKLNMRDFKMTPPTAMLGTIKVGEEVTVVFDFVLTPKK
jgi:polyisoprenoid-binding protein YceI